MSQRRASVIAWYYSFAWLGNCVGAVGASLQNTAAAGTLHTALQRSVIWQAGIVFSHI